MPCAVDRLTNTDRRAERKHADEREGGRGRKDLGESFLVQEPFAIGVRVDQRTEQLDPGAR
eukprot:2492778-Rhodomonas_salina.1